MPVLYLTMNSEIELSPLNEAAKSFDGMLGPDDWTNCSFMLDKNELKVFHNEFLKGGQLVEGGSQKKYIINGMVKMTVKPKVADSLLAGNTEWVVSRVDVTPVGSDGHVSLQYVPSSSTDRVVVTSTLDKPAKDINVMTNKIISNLISREKGAADAEETLSLAIDIMRETGDKEWASRVFESALSRIDGSHDPFDMARRIAIEFVDYTGNYDSATRAILEMLQKPNISHRDTNTLAYFFANYPNHEDFREKAIYLYREIINDERNNLTSEELFQQCAWLRDQLSNDLSASYLTAAEAKASSHWDYIGIAKEYAIAGDRDNFVRAMKMAHEAACDDDDLDTVSNEEKEIIEYFFSE